MNDTLCHRCGRDYSPDTPKHDAPGGSGYAVLPDGNRICYDCSAETTRKAMTTTGRAVLYLQGDTVTDWPGRLSFAIIRRAHGGHNLVGSRTDVWFIGPGRQLWHGRQYGDNSQLVHCRRRAS